MKSKSGGEGIASKRSGMLRGQLDRTIEMLSVHSSEMMSGDTETDMLSAHVE